MCRHSTRGAASRTTSHATASHTHPPTTNKRCAGRHQLLPGLQVALRARTLQELLTTFDGGELREVALSPAEIASTWTVSIDEQVVWDRKADGLPGGEDEETSAYVVPGRIAITATPRPPGTGKCGLGGR